MLSALVRSQESISKKVRSDADAAAYTTETEEHTEIKSSRVLFLFSEHAILLLRILYIRIRIPGFFIPEKSSYK